MKKTMLSGLIILFCITAEGQFIDNYGFKTGAGLSNQYWRYKDESFSGLSGWNDYRTGFIGQVYVEKNLGRFLSFRPAIGYIQKGFVDEITFSTAEGEEIEVIDNRAVLHDLSLDLTLKATPFNKSVKPYIFGGVRGDYLLDYRSVIIGFQGEEYELNTDLFNDFNKLTLGAILGAGVSFMDLFFIDLEYNPAISKNFNSDGLAINDKYFSLTFGLNVNRLFKKQK